MNYRILLTGIWMLTLAAAFSANGKGVYAPQAGGGADSVGHKWVNGKLYVIHKVGAGQTLFAISQRYGTTVEALREANGGLSQLRTGELIQVPYSRYRKKPVSEGGAQASVSTAAASTAAASTAAASNRGVSVPVSPEGKHTVEVGQTLYSIAAKYGVSQADIKKWNQMTSDNVMLGQVLIVSGKQFSDSRQPPMVSAAAQPDSARGTEVAEKVVKPAAAPVSTREGQLRPVKQKGLAEKIDANESAGSKYLALHRDAPIGALVQVTNEINQETIWAKVIGRIPDTSINEDIVIKLSARAFEKISPDTRRFRAEVSYNEPVR